MKRLLILTAALLLLLTACAGGGETETTTQTTAATEPTNPGLYIPGSQIESQTGGEVRQYGLDSNGYYRVSAISDRLLLASGTERTALEVLSGAACTPAGTAALPLDIRLGGWQITYNGFAYYDAGQNQAVYLDSQLQELRRIDLPVDMQGLPAFSPDGGEVFYCVGQELRGLDTQRGLSRLIKSHSCKSQTLLGTFFDGKLVLCSVEKEEGVTENLYISTENGGTRSTDMGLKALSTYEDRFFAVRMDGTTRQNIFGTLDGAVQQLNIPEADIVSALELGGAVGLSTDDTGALCLSFYDLTTCKKTAAVTLPGVGAAASVWADRWSGAVWILSDATEDGGQSLYRWDVKASPVEEETAYAGPVYTQAAPDETGLELLQDRVDALNKAHGTAIRIWNDAVKTPAGHTLEPEYQTPAIERTLNELEQTLALFPEDFLYKSVNTKLRICIVRSVDQEVKALRYWDDGDAFILLSPGVDVHQEFVSAMGYIVDSHILGNSSMLDPWESLNPEGFVYGGDPQQSTAYLEGETKAFADAESMASVSEERARLFFRAMQEDNAAMFESETMQAKLLLLCQAIRDAWRLERKTETYTWEQYLKTPIAYQA